MKQAQKKKWNKPVLINLSTSAVKSGTSAGTYEGWSLTNAMNCGKAGVVLQTGPGSKLVISFCSMTGTCGTGVTITAKSNGTFVLQTTFGLCS